MGQSLGYLVVRKVYSYYWVIILEIFEVKIYIDSVVIIVIIIKLIYPIY